jgi:two-component system chemotaxis response regulator CheY
MATVLLAHASTFVRNLLAAVLASEHTVVAEVTNGVEAVEVYADSDPDVVVMGTAMPIQDGFEACAELTETDDARVVLCARDGGAVTDDADRVGAVGLIASPFQESGVLRAVDAAVAYHPNRVDEPDR